MIPPIHHPPDAIPSASKSQTESGPNSDNHRDAWKREMERAQRNTWFKARPAAASQAAPSQKPRSEFENRPPQHRDLPDGRAGLTVPARPPRDATSAPGSALDESRVGSLRSAAASPLPTIEAESSFLPATTSAQRPAPVQHVSPQDLLRRAAYLEPASAPAAPTERGATARREPVRLHAQWDGDTVLIWLGVDASHSTNTPQLVEALRVWLRGQGLKALHIICNGESVWSESNTPSGSTDHPASSHILQPDTAALLLHVTATREA